MFCLNVQHLSKVEFTDLIITFNTNEVFPTDIVKLNFSNVKMAQS